MTEQLIADYESLRHPLSFVTCPVCFALVLGLHIERHDDWHWLTQTKPTRIDGTGAGE